MAKKDGCKEEWSRAKKLKRPDSIKSHVFIDSVKFVPTYEANNCIPIMSYILGWEYGRQWLKERDDFIGMRVKQHTPKFIKPDINKWLEKHKQKDAKNKAKLCVKT